MIHNTTATASAASKTGGFVFTYELKSGEGGEFPSALRASGMLRFLATALETIEERHQSEQKASEETLAYERHMYVLGMKQLYRRIASLKGVITRMRKK